MTQTLFVYDISHHHLDFIDGDEGKARMAHLLGFPSGAVLNLSARYLGDAAPAQMRDVLRDRFDLTSDALDDHAETIDALHNGYAVFVIDDGENFAALREPRATTGLTFLFSVALPPAMPPPKPPKSDARIGGMVATAVLLFLGMFVTLLVLMSG